MPALTESRFGWRAVLLIASTYVYFLIFAQFAFLARMTELGFGDSTLKPVMALMGLAGIVTSLLTGYTTRRSSPRVRLIVAFALSGSAALLTTLPLPCFGFGVAALFIGSGLGLLTVTLVTFLPSFCGGYPFFETALGTGVGYFCCNIPRVFTAPPRTQAWLAVGVCLLGGLASARPTREVPGEPIRSTPAAPFPLLMLGFSALVWFDSAAFFIIQNTPSLKAGTWQGNLHLWTNGTLHLLAALGCAWILKQSPVSVRIAQALAILALGSACLLLDAGHAPAASLLYPIGVSIYSVALVAYPALLSGVRSPEDRGRRAAWLYGVAGWFSSAMGIGMAQHLGRIPVWFIVLAASVVVLPLLGRILIMRIYETTAVAALLLVALCIALPLKNHKGNSSSTPEERGRRVYISEGCIHCHSQYVRPHSDDVLLWGPTQTLAELRQQHPPLIGNRRQGPDLSEVGSRRSALWLTAHFEDPRALTPQSFMPSYDYLFANGDTRGADLVAYLASLQTTAVPQHLALEAAWRPSAAPTADALRGKELYALYCATCHNRAGEVRVRWSPAFRRLPPDILQGILPGVDRDVSPQQRANQLSRIIKFGVHGTDMPGHEYLPDSEIAALTSLLLAAAAPPNQVSASLTTKGTP